MFSRRLDAEVTLSPDATPKGEYANAFRILEDGSQCILEFLVFSPSQNKAFVVRRISLRQEFLPVVGEHLQRVLQGSPQPAVVGALF